MNLEVTMGNLVNGDVSIEVASGKRQLERVHGDGPTLKYKRRNVSAHREFPQGCGRYALRIDGKTSKDVDGGRFALVEDDCVKPLEKPVELGTVDVDKTTVTESLQLSKSLILETTGSFENLDKMEGHDQLKVAGSPKVLNEIEVVNPSKSLEAESSDLSKTEFLDSMNNLEESMPMDLLGSAQPEEKEVLAVNLPVDIVSSDLPLQPKFSDQSQTSPAVDTLEKAMQKKYPPRRRISACRDFPEGCGRNAPRITREVRNKSVVSSTDRDSASIVKEECQKSLSSSKERNLVNEKKQIVGGETKQMREEVEDGDASWSKPKGRITKELENEVRGNSPRTANSTRPPRQIDVSSSDRGVKKDTIDRRVASESKLKRENTLANSNRPPRQGGMSSTDLKSPTSGKKVDRESDIADLKAPTSSKTVNKGSDMSSADLKSPSSSKKVERVGSSGGKSGKESLIPNKDTSIKRKVSEKSADGGRAIIQFQESRSVNEKVIVQGLMAAANCPWRQGKRAFKSPNSVTPSTARSRGKKQESVQDNTKSISKRKNDEPGTSKGKSTKKKMSPIRPNDEGGMQLVLNDEDDFPVDDDEEGNHSLVKKSQDRAVSLFPLGFQSLADKEDESEAVVTRKKVRETLRLFQAVYRKLVQEEEAKSKDGQVSGRFDIISATILKDKHRWVNTGKPIVGDVPGVEVGDEFHYRVELAIVGLHRPYQSGIDYITGKNLATSIVSSGGHGDEMDSDVLRYSGQGGTPAGADKKAEDQKLVRGNLAMKNSMDQRIPIRVIRGFKETKSSDSGNSRGKVSSTYTYDGLYMIERYWQEAGRYGANVFMFELRRIPGQPELALKEVKKSKKAKVREGLRVADISEGKEKMPICAINTIDDENPPPFTYITSMIYPSSYNLSPPRGCECIDGCSDSEKCLCAVKNGGEIPYNYDGAIVEAKHLVHECGPLCKCPPSCHNRVSQHGIKFQLEIFKTNSRGWGVRSLASIPSGSFICEYTGELLQDKEAEERTNDEYLFDIGNNYNDPFWQGLSTVMPSDLKTSSSSENVEDVGFTIDAAEYGSIGRFINHSCSPNLYAQNVLYDHEDKRMPHIMLFAADNIPPLQELTYHYNYQLDQVRDSDGNIKKKDCYCGAADCSDRMY